MYETIIASFFSCVGAIIGAIIGGIVALRVCRMTIKNNKDIFLWERFKRVCDEFNDLDEKITKAYVPIGDETGTGIKHEDLSEFDINKIFFFLSEIEQISKEEYSYMEAFFTINHLSLYKMLHIKNIIDNVFLKQDESNVSIIEPKNMPSNHIYKNSQSCILKFAKFINEQGVC